MVIIGGNAEENPNIKPDSGFYFGRGVFETILVKDKPVFLAEHCERLARGLAALKIDNSVDESDILRYIEQHDIKNCVLKIAVSEKNIIASTRPIPYLPEDYEKGFRIKISTLKRNPYSHITYIKSLNYIDNVLEKEQAEKEGYDEVLFLNVHDELAEGSISNIFFVKENEIYTPEVRCGILEGIVRKWVLDNHNVHQGKFMLSDIADADEVFLTNSIMGIMKVRFIEGVKAFKSGRKYEAVKESYDKMILC